METWSARTWVSQSADDLVTRSTIGCLIWPRVIENPQLDEQTELVGSDPLLDDLVILEMHNGDRPFLEADRPGGGLG